MSAVRESTLTIETPEGVRWAWPLATPAVRAIAWAVDAAMIVAVTYVTGRLSHALAGLSSDWATALAMMAYWLVGMAYATVLEWRWRGQTVGKRLLRLRVIDSQGLQLRFSQVALRNLIRVVDILPLAYLVGGASALLSRAGQRLGDLAAGTVVIREPEQQEPDIERIAPARYNSLLAWPTLAARLRSVADPEPVAIALSAIARRDRFDSAARIEVFRDLAAYFRELVPFPDSALEGLTDEQYVRSVVGAVFVG